MKISAVYKITNTVTNDFYIGSSKDVKRRWKEHKIPSRWKQYPNNPMYIDMNRYGVENFAFEVLEVVEESFLKKTEQEFIETLKPTYNNNNAKGWNIERRKKYNKEYNKSDKFKEYKKEYQKSDKYKEYQKEYRKKYRQSEKGKESQKKYQKSDKGKESQKKYYNQLCFYNGETLTLNALSTRFRKQGIPHPTQEAKKYLLKQ